MGSGLSKPLTRGAICIVIRFADGAFRIVMPDVLVGRSVLYNRFYQKHRDHSCYDFENARPPFLWRLIFIMGLIS